MPGDPFAKFDHDFVADARRSTDVLWFWNVNVVRNTRVIRDDVQELPPLLERPNQGAASSFQYSYHTTGAARLILVRAPCQLSVPPHQYPIPVQGSRCGIRRNDYG